MQKITEFQNREKALAETALGKAFKIFEDALSRATQLDTEDSHTDRYRKATEEAWNKHRIARQEFVRLLIEVTSK